MPHYLHPVSARVRLPIAVGVIARAGALAAGVAFLAVGGVVPFVILRALSDLGLQGPPSIPVTLAVAAGGGLLAWWGALLLWASFTRTSRVTVADENIVVRHQAWLRAPLVVYRSQVLSVRIEAESVSGGVNFGLPGRANVSLEFNEPKRIDGLRPLIAVLVARRRRPLGLSFRVADPGEARSAFENWINPPPPPPTEGT